MKTLFYLIILIIIITFPLSNSSADIFKCFDDAGKTVYQTESCKDDEGEKIIESKEYTPPNTPQNKSSKSDILKTVEDYDNELIRLKIVDHGFNITDTEVEFLRSGAKFLYYFYKRFFGYDGSMNVKMNIFGKKEDYYNTQLKFVSSIVSNAGVYFPDADEGLINGERKRKAVFESTIHEITHAILRKKVRFIPLWINEGMAEYFETLSIKDESIIISPQDLRYRQLEQLSKSSTLMPLREYFALNSSPFTSLSQAHNQLSRTMAWSIVHFLMSSESGQKSLFRMIKDLRTSGGKNSVEIIDKNYSGGIDGLERKWHNHLKTASKSHYYDDEALKLFH
ncbi:MAG: DUF1570 domain-containing protein [Thermodesulfobacteriota bacterium]